MMIVMMMMMMVFDEAVGDSTHDMTDGYYY